MGFELINKENNDSKTKLDDNMGDLVESKIIESEQGSCNNNVFCAKTAVENLNNAVVNTVLNSKTPLYKDDPINVVMTPQFLLYSCFASSVMVFVSALF